MDSEIECVCVSVNLCNIIISVCVLYRSPSSSAVYLDHLLSQLLSLDILFFSNFFSCYRGFQY